MCMHEFHLQFHTETVLNHIRPHDQMSPFHWGNQPKRQLNGAFYKCILTIRIQFIMILKHGWKKSFWNKDFKLNLRIIVVAQLGDGGKICPLLSSSWFHACCKTFVYMVECLLSKLHGVHEQQSKSNALLLVDENTFASRVSSGLLSCGSFFVSELNIVSGLGVGWKCTMLFTCCVLSLLWFALRTDARRYN